MKRIKELYWLLLLTPVKEANLLFRTYIVTPVHDTSTMTQPNPIMLS